MIKYLNNIIEQEHRHIKCKTKSMLRFDSFETAQKTISGIEVMNMIRKGQVYKGQCVLSEIEFINQIMEEAA